MAQTDQRDLSTLEKIGAKRLLESYQSTPHFAVAVEIDMSAVLARKDSYQASGRKVSITALVAERLAGCLRRHEGINARFEPPAAVVYAPEINLGIAVSTERGLTVPVLKGADRMELEDLANNLSELVQKARGGRLSLTDFQDGTFTLSNLGNFGIDWFTAIINPPQGAILATGGIIEKPVVIDHKLEIRPVMTAVLSSDHRIIDGVRAAQFMADLKASLERVEE